MPEVVEVADEGGKKMSLLGGLIYEGMGKTLEAFQQMSKEEQTNVVNSTADNLKAHISQIQLASQQIKNDHIKQNMQIILDNFLAEIEDAVKDSVHHPLHAFSNLMMIPVHLGIALNELVWGALFGWLENMFMPRGPVSYDEALLHATQFYTLTGDLNVIASIFDILGDIEILGTKLPGKAVGRFITNLSWTFGLGWMSWVVLSPVLEASIADPMQKEIRKVTRSRNWTPTDIRQLYEYGIDKLEEHVEHLAELGYSDDKILKLLDLMKRTVIREEARSWVTYMLQSYVKGYITDKELMNAIAMAYWTNEERNFKFWQGKVRRETETIDLRVSEIEKAFKSKKIDENEARSRLAQYIVDPERIEAYIALWKQYLKPEEEVTPLETANLKLQKLKIRIEGIQKQIEHLEVVMKQQLDIYDTQAQILIDRLNAQIAAAKEEYAAFADKTHKDLQARIVYLQSLLPVASDKEKVKIQAKIELLQTLAQSKLSERSTKADALMERWKKETEGKLELLKKKKAKYEEDMKRRIDELETKLEEYQLEAEATEQVLKKLEAGA